MTMTIPEALPESPDELRDLLLAAGDDLRGLHSKRPDTGDRAAVDSWKRDVAGLVDLIHVGDPALTAMTATTRNAPQARGGAGTGTDLGPDRRTAGAIFTESDAYKSAGNMRAVPEVEVRTLLDSAITDPAAGIWRPVGTPIPPTPRRARLFVRDLISVQDTTLASVPYIRELNPTTNEVSATAVAEGSAKPEIAMEFVQDDAPVRKLAAWIPVTEEIIADAPTLRGYIDNRLAYMLALREEAQILNGPGTAPNLKGILQFSGVQTRAAVASDPLATLGLALGQVENVDGDADGIAMNPLEFWTMLTTRSASQFDQGWGNMGPFGVQPAGVWGVPVVRTRQLALKSAIVGAWALGATLFQREGTTLRTTDSHQDYFILNKLVILVEERVSLAVERPDFFVNVTMP